MKIIVAGTGFVGLTHAAVCSEYGHEVYAYDIDEKSWPRIARPNAEQIDHYVNEPGLPRHHCRKYESLSVFLPDGYRAILLKARMRFFCASPTPPQPEWLVRPELITSRRCDHLLHDAGETPGQTAGGAD